MRFTRIVCNCCGAQDAGGNYASLWRKLRLKGWTGGWRDTHFCPACVAQGKEFEMRALLHESKKGEKHA